MDINNIQSSDYVLNSSREYSIYVCSTRAIPKVADGLKDSQRKAIWIIKGKADKIKTVSLAGEMISSNLYLHGDKSASDAISQLAAPFNNNICFLDGIGNFGNRVGPTNFGAPRYTYVKRNKVTSELLLKDLEIVPTIENYDGSTREPKHFLPLIPLVLLNGISGIAVGWSTDILPHRLDDIIDSCVDCLDNKQQKALHPFFNNYKLNIYKDGNNWMVEGDAIIEDTSTVKIIELPPDLGVDKFRERLSNLEEEGKINSWLDKSTAKIDIRVKFPRGSVKDWSRADAIAFFKLKQKLNQRLVVIHWDDNSIKQFENTEELIKEFVEWRLGWYKVRYEYIKKMILEDIKYWTAIKLCFDKKLPSSLQKMNNKAELKDLIKKIILTLSPDDDLMEKITGLATYKWTQEYHQESINNIADLNARLLGIEAILTDPVKQKKIYREELIELKKKKLG